MKLNRGLLVLAAALCANSVLAQGKIEFDWVPTAISGTPKSALGITPIFQASFVFDALLMSPYSTGLWPGYNTDMTVISPDHSWPRDGGLGVFYATAGSEFRCDASGGYNVEVWALLGTWDVTGTWQTRTAWLYNNQIVQYAAPGSRTVLYEEDGFW
jgi:hypothetical protein